MKSIQRLFWLGVLSGAGFVGWNVWQRKHESAPPPVAEWLPIEPSSATPATAATASSFVALPNDDGADSGPPETVQTATASAAERWVESTDGACPISHPIKANDNSGIYHVPGGRFYDQTGAERCYLEASDAEADGYRAAKS